MQRVAVLSHVKASSAPPSTSSDGGRRIAWHGGKISSNKEEALQKFYQRKLRAGDHLMAQQIAAMQSTMKLDVQKKSKKQHATRRPHAKVTATGAHHTVLKTGRVLGPRLEPKQKGKKKINFSGKQQTARQPKTVQKQKSFSIPLEDRLGLPLDALVGGKNNRSSTAKRR